MKVYVVTDLEGICGVGGFDVWRYDSPGEAMIKREERTLWANQVNAAVEGAVEVGATEIVVLDNHSAGDTLPRSLLAAPARLIHGRGRSTWLPALDDSYAALLMVGAHAMAGSGGHLSHTYSRRHIRRVRINGLEVGEIGLVAGISGSFGVPVVFVSGDDVATEEARQLIPAVEIAAVKRSLSIGSCVCLPESEAVERIRTGVRQGIANRAENDMTSFAGEIELRVDYTASQSWRAPVRWLVHGGKRGRPGWPGCVVVRDRSVTSAWDRFVGLA